MKLRFYPNNTRNEAIMYFSTEERVQLPITKINTYEEWKIEL